MFQLMTRQIIIIFVVILEQCKLSMCLCEYYFTYSETDVASVPQNKNISNSQGAWKSSECPSFFQGSVWRGSATAL